MSSVFKLKYRTLDPKTGQRRKSRCWYGYLTNAKGARDRVKLNSDKTASRTILGEKQRKIDRREAGIVDPYEDFRLLPVQEHVAGFQRSLQGKANSAKHVNLTIARLNEILDGCRVEKLDELSATDLLEWLTTQRQSSAFGTATSNDHLGVAKSFGQWLAANKRLQENPFVHLKPLNEDVDVRRKRRAASVEECKWLLTAARAGVSFRGLTGEDREMLYLVAVYTGFRVGELASLTPRNFQLDGEQPTVTVAASYSKRRREDVQPIRCDLADNIREWLSVKRDEDPEGILWGLRLDSGKRGPSSWCNIAAAMLHRDLLAARWLWIAAEGHDDAETQRRIKSDTLKPVDAAGSVLDFHALRHTFITNLVLAEVHPKKAQELARHSTFALTMDRYTHLQVAECRSALDSLPNLPRTEPDASEIALPATGTDGQMLHQNCIRISENAPNMHRTGVHSMGSTDQMKRDARQPNRASLKDLGNSSPSVTIRYQKAPVGVEPTMADLQSAALATWLRRPICFDSY